MIEAKCDCGAVRIEIDAPAPQAIWDCPCTICQKLGVLWAYYPPSQVRIVAGANATSIYKRARRILEFHTCRVCGCTTHWVLAGENKGQEMGVNSRLMDPVVRQQAEVRVNNSNQSTTGVRDDNRCWLIEPQSKMSGEDVSIAAFASPLPWRRAFLIGCGR